MINRTFKLLKGLRGSAMVMAIVTTVVLAILALAIMTLSMGNLTVSQADAINNDAYYAAESGVNSALEQLKGEVLDYYNDMMTANSVDYNTLYDNFFTRINNNAILDFRKPLFKDLDTQTTFTTGTFDSTNNVCEFLISCLATSNDGNSKYQVDAKLYVKRLNVKRPTWLTLDDVAYKIGGALNLNAGYGVYNGGSVVTNTFNNPKNIYYNVQPPGKFVVDKNVTGTINDTLVYPSYTTPSIAEFEAMIKLVDPAKGYEIKTYTSDTTLGYGAFSTVKPVLIIAEKNLTINSTTTMYPGSIVYCKGNLTISVNTSSNKGPIKCYCDGTVTTSSGVYADIFCRGNISTSDNFHGNVICDGNCINACNTFVGTMIVNGTLNCNGGLTGSFFAGGTLTITNGINGNNVIYSKTKVILNGGGYSNAVVFSGGDIDVGNNGKGSSLTGAVLAKGNVNQNAYLTLDYSRTAITNIMNPLLHDSFYNNFFFPTGGGGEMNSSDDIIVDQEITAKGRQ